ncbi:MAG: rhomboid family intramembrane serine protease [Salinivirgaceae bacterium]|nr:MAG: rhomboid family intramembrane serine protease [Salinivirgaceae bacterium]
MIIFIIVLTGIVSVYAFQQPEIMYRYNFSPYQIVKRKQWYRMLSHALLHADWMHLIVNMLVLYSFAIPLRFFFNLFFSYIPASIFILIFYILAIGASSIVSLVKHKDNPNYNALGASGAVSAVVFACIFFAPLEEILFFGVIPVPGILFGIGYLWYSWYMGKKNVDNVGHDAHFYGAIFGFIFPLILRPELIHQFIYQLINW